MTNITSLRCDLEYAIHADTHFCFNIQASRRGDQRILDESLTITPGIQVRQFEDPNNGNRFFRCDGIPGKLVVRYDARIENTRQKPDHSLVECSITDMPNEVLHYLLPSRFCQSDVMSRAAQHLFGRVPQGYQRVSHICDWIRENIAYQLGTSNATTSAQDVYLQRAGVCRDYAHLAITFCRALNIPARLVVGYVHFDEPPQDFHATFEAWLGGQWVMFDPTNLAPAEAVVRVGTGRDAKDTAFATMFGAVTMSYMHIQVNHDGQPPLDDPDPREATVQRLIMA
ncbi:transglutaminase family protein [Xylophilus sp. GOD-11R]|uniref:transglutaminase-like domain-containing protein n=1 Tax=Xylophilus sp. GOD-11R TaxID=3089814 RepID=UPI00298BE8B2|nr:transglutaminase family protein [Xylophilus sp. GOD-11R]WPB56991.1 transglutaminase family protein [Xylophilus sp. GOD-11R]